MSASAGGNGPVSRMVLCGDALRLAEDMLQRDDVMRTILTETLESGQRDTLTESGRTVCGSAKRPLPPILRRFVQVTLPTCPMTVGGTWHTHVTREQLLTPENSLPDWANVAFGVIDVSIVVGAEASEVVVGSRDRSVMVGELRQVLGAEVDSVEDVVERLLAGDVHNPRGARARLRQQLDPVVFTVETAFPDLAAEIRDSTTLASIADAPRAADEMAVACPMYDLATAQPLGGIESFRRFRGLARANAADIQRLARQSLPPEDVDIRSQAWATGIGFFVSQLLSDLLT